MRTAGAYLLLACLYLIYVPHADFLLDDWGVVARYEKAAREGTQLQVASDLIHNQFHGQFRFQWLGFGTGFLLFLLAGANPGVMYGFLVAVHCASAMVLRQALVRLGVAGGPAFLAGVLFLLWPGTHPALLWSFNCSFLVLSTFWFLLYLRSLAGSLQEKRLTPGDMARQALFLMAALFSGDPVFGLLLAGGPLVAWFVRSPMARRVTLLAWGTAGTAAVVYALFINRIPMVQRGVGLRFQFSFENWKANFLGILDTYDRLTGLGDGGFYRLKATAVAVTAALVAAGVVALLARRGRESRPWRTLLLAGALWFASYGPVWFIRGHEYRYDYVAGPYVALALATAVWIVPRVRVGLGAGLAAWFAVASVGSIEQSWIPQSRDLRAIGAALREGTGLVPGDLVVVSRTPMWTGAVSHFAFLTDWAATAYVQRAAGVADLTGGCEIVRQRGRLRMYQRTAMRDLGPGDPGRTVVFVDEGQGKLRRKFLLAEEVGAGEFRVHPLRGYSGPDVSDRVFRRDQLGLLEADTYFVRNLEDHKSPES